MNLYQRYQKLTVWNKLGVWSGIITILSFIVSFLYSNYSENKSNQADIDANSSGNVVIQSNRDIIINNPSADKSIKDSIYNKMSPDIDSSKISIGANSVVSINQHGGQTANTINNITVNSGDRFIPPNIASVLKKYLSKFKNKSVSVIIQNMDMQGSETIRFAEELKKIFSLSGWNDTLINNGNTIANVVVTTGLTINAIGDSNMKIADFIRTQFIPLGYRVSCKFHPIDKDNKDLYIEVWTK